MFGRRQAALQTRIHLCKTFQKGSKHCSAFRDRAEQEWAPIRALDLKANRGTQRGRDRACSYNNIEFSTKWMQTTLQLCEAMPFWRELQTRGMMLLMTAETPI